ncbi:hypothetical protein RJ641_022744 [Dillenia turbinata]|uniref:Uncharacterized protein n=1 Tax=Dillenia turbinata TaxID=194707 RepID=A0AAN8YXG5_9MAGN
MERNQSPESSLGDKSHLQSDNHNNIDDIDADFSKGGCCFWTPCLGSGRPSSAGGSFWWERISFADHNNANSSTIDDDEKWWSIGLNALKKIREWSEIVAGPKWKTFIRRFRKSTGIVGGKHGGKFQYDPLSYALNFDEGQNGNLDDDNYVYRNFSSRYASIPASAKSSMDLGKDGPSFT